MPLLSLLPKSPGLNFASLSNQNTGLTAKRLTMVGEWYVPSGADTAEWTMALVATPALDAMLAGIKSGNNLYMPGTYSGWAWMAGKGVPCLQVGLSGTSGNAEGFATSQHMDTFGITLATSTYYRLTGWVEWYAVQTNSGSTYPRNLMFYGWKLETIDGAAGAVIDTLADWTLNFLGPVGISANLPWNYYAVSDQYPPSSFVSYDQYAKPALSLNAYNGPGQFTQGYSADPSSTDSFWKAVLAKSPVGAWRGQERLGTTLWDSSGNGNDGSYEYGWSGLGNGYDSMGVPGAIPGSAAAMNGYNNGGNNFAIKTPITISTTEFTIQFAANARSWTANSPRLAATGHTDTSNNGFQIAYNGFDTANFPNLEANIGNGSSQFVTGDSAALNTDEWYLIHLTYSSSAAALTLFVNGASVGSVTTSGTVTTGSETLHFGNNPVYKTGDFNGAIQDMAYWDSALTATDISDLYTAWTNAGA